MAEKEDGKAKADKEKEPERKPEEPLSEEEMKDVAGGFIPTPATFGNPLSSRMASRLRRRGAVGPVDPEEAVSRGPVDPEQSRRPDDPKHPWHLCFGPETLVPTRKGYQPISGIAVGDEIVSVTFDGTLFVDRVEKLDVHHGEISVIELSLDDDVILVTPDHKVWSGEKWIRAADSIYVSRTKVGRIVPAVYNLRTTTGTYLVGYSGLLVSGGRVEDLHSEDPVAEVAR
ncbi:MAG: hypothetical protein D6679_07460 [Candidatus Hydrogenedentota bacterium]|nr:MAG: hypothetical protein D6679_07460 [Candidatus Hydrogenedentota bacterium]